MIRRIKKRFFTLLELMISLGVLSLVVLISMQFLNTSQKVWQFASDQQNSSLNARIALNMITRDLQCVYYGDDSNYAPFWHCNPQKQTAWKAYRNELIAFVSSTPVTPNDICTSDLYEIKYQNYYYDGTSQTDKDLNGWLRRSITGNMTSKRTNSKWNFFSSKSGNKVSYGNANNAFTANSNSSESYQKLIPYVTNLSFTCYDRTGDVIPAQIPKNNTSTQYNLSNYNSLNLDDTWSNEENVSYSAPPYSINVSLSLMDKDSWNKWVSLIPENDRINLNPYIENINNKNKSESNQTPAYRYRIKNQRTFSSTVFIGNRGQYDL